MDKSTITSLINALANCLILKKVDTFRNTKLSTLWI